MASSCTICGRGDLHRIGKLPGRKVCNDCAARVVDAFLAARRATLDFSDPIQALRSEVQALADKAAASAGARMDYDRGRADAHNYDLALVIYAGLKTTPEGVPA